jgi:hypothetical protein
MAKRPREISASPAQVGISKLRKKIRDLSRALKKSQGNAEKVAATERAIEATKTELADLTKNRHARETAKRYHMVRFFERKKAMRRLKRVVKAEPDSKEKLQIAEAGWYYVNRFPIDSKYIAIFASEKTEKPDFFKELLDKVKKGQLPSGIRNGDSVAFIEYPIEKTNMTKTGVIVGDKSKLNVDDYVKEGTQTVLKEVASSEEDVDEDEDDEEDDEEDD